VIVHCMHCCFSASRSLETPCTLSNPFPVELDQVAHGDRTNDGVEENGPHGSDKSLRTHI
jgi:hypothetical protein